MMRLAVTSPMPGNLINSSEVAVLMFKQDPAISPSGFDPDSLCFIREAELKLVLVPASLHVAKMSSPRDKKSSFTAFIL